MSEPTILEGAEPFSAPGGPNGALVLHGFTGSPQSMRGLATALAEAGFAVELPRLPGHGTSVADMLTTDWADWSAAVEAAYLRLAGQCDHVVVTGLSMGGTLTLWLATRHPEIAGIAVINGLAQAPQGMLPGLADLLDQGVTTTPGIGADIADPDSTELAYDAAPVAGLLSLLEAADALDLEAIECPVLVLTSPEDHVVPPSSSDAIADGVSGKVERVSLDRSYHVATLDYDKDEIERRIVEFAERVTG